METLYFLVEENDVRLDKYLTGKINGQTRNYIQKLIASDSVLVNEKIKTNKYKVKIGDSIIVTIPEIVPLTVEAEDIPLDIVYEDKDLLVVNKPQGMVVHPANGNPTGTLVNALMAHCKDELSGINGVARPGIVHRIDKNTSGLLIVAKSDPAHIGLAKQIKEHSFKREYKAIVMGNLKADSGTIDAPIGRSAKDRKKMCVTEKNSKQATTYYEVLKRFEKFTYIKCILKTGRTHQIRVHMAYIYHPLLGDDVYGKVSKLSPKGQCLHAETIGFIHPITNVYMEFKAPLPDYFKRILETSKEI
ncbi:MAG: RluA family pseudouridine synthase [Clostridia bacterium]